MKSVTKQDSMVVDANITGDIERVLWSRRSDANIAIFVPLYCRALAVFVHAAEGTTAPAEDDWTVHRLTAKRFSPTHPMKSVTKQDSMIVDANITGDIERMVRRNRADANVPCSADCQLRRIVAST